MSNKCVTYLSSFYVVASTWLTDSHHTTDGFSTGDHEWLVGSLNGTEIRQSCVKRLQGGRAIKRRHHCHLLEEEGKIKLDSLINVLLI